MIRAGLQANREVFITCAVNGGGDTTALSDKVPVTPRQIAEDAIAAARAGAAIVHCHVRDPATGKASRDPALFRELTDRIRAADIDVVLNLTSSGGGYLAFGAADAPLPPDAMRTDVGGVGERLRHVEQCRPEICTLDCGSMNLGDGSVVMANPVATLRAMAEKIRTLGVRAEIEAFDSGHLWLARQLAADGLIEAPVFVQLCLGIGWGAPDDLATFLAMAANVPEDWVFSAFSTGANAAAYVGAAVLAGGNVRVGLEDCLTLPDGSLATNPALVERAVAVIENMGARVIGPAEVRTRLRLRDPRARSSV